MSNINKDAVLNPFSDLTANILDYVPRATTSEFGIVAIGSGINVDALGRIYLDTQEYSDRLTAIEAQAASSLATQQTEVAAAIAQVNLAQSQTITALTLEVNNLKTNLTDSITATQTDLINRADQLAQDVTDITDQLTQDKAAFTQEIQDALVYLENEASVASALRTPRKINGVDFDGTQDITLPLASTSVSGTVKLNDTLTSTATDHALTAAQGKVLNDSKLDKAANAVSASKLKTPRTISLTGGVTGSVSFDGSANASIDTTVTGLGVANGIATLDASGQVPSTQLPSYVDDVLEYLNIAAFPTTGETGKIYVETAGNTTYRWSGSAYVKITSGEVSSVAGKIGVVTLTKSDVGLANVDNTADSAKSVASATKLTTARTINGVDFDGSSNITIADNTKLPLTGGTITGSLNIDSENSALRFGNNLDIGFVKQSGATGKLIIGNAANFEIAQSSEVAIPSTISSTLTQTFPTLLTLTPAGVLSTKGGFSGNISGNATTANSLQTARTINGVSFDGTQDITVPTVGIVSISNGGTGATTAEQARVNLGLTPIRLNAGTDLNTVTTAGVYYCDANVDVATMLNVPITLAFVLKVDQTAGVIQEFTAYADSGSRRFIRGMYTGWFPWEEVVKGNKRLKTDSGQTGITAPNTEAGIYITADGYPYLNQGTASTAPRWHIHSGGTGGTTAAEARANLGLGSAATRNIGIGVGEVVTSDSARRAFGSVNIDSQLPGGWDFNNLSQGDYVFYDSGMGYSPNAPPMPYCSLYTFRNLTSSDQLTVLGHDYFTGGIITRGKNNGSWSGWAKHYHTLNTTINGNGYIVPSSPTVKIHPDSFELNEDSTKLGAVCEKLGVGHYEISNVDGFHQEGWYFDIPTDRYKNPLIVADYEYLPDERKIVIKAYAVKANTFPFEPDLDIPMDAPQGRWIDVRLYEPEWLNKTELPKPEEPIVDGEGNAAPSRLHELVEGVWVISEENAAILEQARLAAMKPLKRRQFRLTLAMNGYDLNEIEALINQIEDPMQRTIAQIEWQDATDFERTNPTLLMMAQMLGLTSEQVDSLWEYGLTL